LAPANIDETFTFSEEGYYRIVIAASAVPTLGLSGRPIDGSSRTLWVLIAQDGGGSTKEYVPPGPRSGMRLLFGAYGPYRRLQHTPSQNNPKLASNAADPFYLYGTYKYFDHSTDSGYYVWSYVPVGSGYVNATCHGRSDSSVLIPDVHEQVITAVQPDGRFNVWCPEEAAYAWDHIDGIIYPRRLGVVDVRNSSGSANGSGFLGYNEDDITIYAVSDNQAHALTVLSDRISSVTSAFGLSRSEIQAWVWDSGSILGGYIASSDRIEYRDGDHMWNARGPYYVMHEYGHAFHWEAIEEPVYDAEECEGHDYDSVTSLSCALVEGFAEMFGSFFLADFMTTGNGDHDEVVEANIWRDDGDGSLIEGAIAGFFYDLVDDEDTPDGPTNQTNGDDDLATYSPASIAAILSSCNMPGLSLIDGIDRFVYCAEETLEMQDSINSATGDYWFASRRPTVFTSYSVTSQSLSRAIVRRTWKYNLFNQGTLK
jgi:hypothetical protein